MGVTNPKVFSHLYSTTGLQAQMKNDISFKAYAKWLEENKEDRHLEGLHSTTNKCFGLQRLTWLAKSFLEAITLAMIRTALSQLQGRQVKRFSMHLIANA